MHQRLLPTPNSVIDPMPSPSPTSGPPPRTAKGQLLGKRSNSYSQMRYSPADAIQKSPSRKLGPSHTAKYSLAPDPNQWGGRIFLNQPEPDDVLHNPDPRRDRKHDSGGTIFTARGLGNIGCLIIIMLALLALFAVYPILSALSTQVNPDPYNLRGFNATGQVPEVPGRLGLIDSDTPKEAYTYISIEDGNEWDLVFSDEFNVEGRSFYPGDDPYWEALDEHYWQTKNLEWYSPDMVTTSNGYLNFTLEKTPWRGMEYKGGMIQSWNKFCFTGGYFVANVSLPGKSTVNGLWPALWAMGNLGRAGFGASLDGLWPYTYDTCDVGTLPNQTFPDGTPINATRDGDPGNAGVLSFLPGQRLSACTCPGESHPGPIRPDGSFVGRSAPEIDLIEATVDTTTRIGHVSMSGQWAPYNYAYDWFDTPENMQIHKNTTILNGYHGGVYQMVTSGLGTTNQDCYTQGGGCFAVYGFEYKAGNDGYITWVNDNEPAWTIRGAGMGADPRVEIGPRPISMEPMYLILNLGISPNFGPIEYDLLELPSWMLVDWIRVYQPKDAHNVGCDPPGFPTTEYIQTYIEAYTNPNLTTWVDDINKSFQKTGW